MSDRRDWCIRDLTVDLTRDDVYGKVFAARLWSNHNPTKLCFNRAFGCREQTYEAFKEAGLLELKKGDTLTPETLLKLWEVMFRDNSNSAA